MAFKDNFCIEENVELCLVYYYVCQEPYYFIKAELPKPLQRLLSQYAAAFMCNI